MTSVRKQLADRLRPDLPVGWDLVDRPKRLGAFLPGVLVTIVIEQRGLATDRFSSDGESIPVQSELAVWVIVDGSQGTDEGELEDRLELAAEWMIRELEVLVDEAWDGTAERGAYDAQKPAYQFPVRVTGTIEQTDPEEVTP